MVRGNRYGKKDRLGTVRDGWLGAVLILGLVLGSGCEPKQEEPESLRVEFFTTPPEVTTNELAIFRFTCSERPCNYLCRLNEEVFLACKDEHKLTGLLEGRYRLQVYAFGPRGMISPVEHYSWEVITEEEAYEREEEGRREKETVGEEAEGVR